MPVTFAIMSSGRWNLLQQCLLSLKPFSERKIIVASTPLPANLMALLDENDISLVEPELHVGRQRNRALELCDHGLIYFLDEDCTGPTVFALKHIQSAFDKNSQLVAAGGPYRSSHAVGFCGQIYNHMTNLWLEQINANKNYFCFVGGNMILNMSRVPGQTRFSHATAFGGEEIEFFSNLHDGHREGLLSATLAVDHHAQHSLLALVRRACLHGSKQSVHWIRQRTSWSRLFRSPVLSAGALAYVGLVRLRRLIPFVFAFISFAGWADTSGCPLGTEQVGIQRMSLPTFSIPALLAEPDLGTTQLADYLRSQAKVSRLHLGEPEFSKFAIDARVGFFYEGFFFPSLAHFIAAMPYANPMIEDQQRMFQQILQRATVSGANSAVSDDVFLNGLELKFRQNPELQQQLLSLGESFLVVVAADSVLGNGRNDTGQNKLGKALMTVRWQLLADSWGWLQHRPLMALRQWALLHGHRVFLRTTVQVGGRSQQTQIYVVKDDGKSISETALEDYRKRFLKLLPVREAQRDWTWTFVAIRNRTQTERALEMTTIPSAPNLIKGL